MSQLFEQLLRVRDLDQSFLLPKYEDSVDPFLLMDMEKAVQRLKKAADKGEKVLIYGDYDADGVTASVVMRDTLKLLGVKELEIMLPNRFVDGYGMSKKVVQKAKGGGFSLVVTVDCGSRNHEVIDELRQLGVDTIVTDHHECGETLPPAVAVINPKRKDLALHFGDADMDGFVDREAALLAMNELRGIAGVGVAFKVAQALVQRGLIPDGQEKWLLDLVLIGTICDSMELTGENRRLAWYGFKVLTKTRRPGLKELFLTAGVKDLKSKAIGFQIGPRLNAAGRMDTAEQALELLLCQRKTQATAQAVKLEALNKERKRSQEKAFQEIIKKGVGSEPVIVVQGDWHEGILGIIAGRLVEEYRRPTFVLSQVDNVLKGSGRSFGDFNLAEALKSCENNLIGGGGHAEACGLKLKLDKFKDFKKQVNEYYQSLNLCNQERFLDVQEDLILEDFGGLTLAFLQELAQLEPFGEGNPEPVFLLPEVQVLEAAKLGSEQNHLRLVVRDKNGATLKLMKFYAPEEYLSLQGGEFINVWINLVENEFRGIKSVEGCIVKLG